METPGAPDHPYFRRQVSQTASKRGGSGDVHIIFAISNRKDVLKRCSRRDGLGRELCEVGLGPWPVDRHDPSIGLNDIGLSIRGKKSHSLDGPVRVDAAFFNANVPVGRNGVGKGGH